MVLMYVELCWCIVFARTDEQCLTDKKKTVYIVDFEKPFSILYSYSKQQGTDGTEFLQIFLEYLLVAFLFCKYLPLNEVRCFKPPTGNKLRQFSPAPVSSFGYCAVASGRIVRARRNITQSASSLGKLEKLGQSAYWTRQCRLAL